MFKSLVAHINITKLHESVGKSTEVWSSTFKCTLHLHIIKKVGDYPFPFYLGIYKARYNFIKVEKKNFKPDIQWQFDFKIYKRDDDT